MRQFSEMRDRIMGERRASGVPAYHYFEEVYDRWIRMFGPDFAIRPYSRFLSTRTNGGTMMHIASDPLCSAVARIRDNIRQPSTLRAFERHAYGGGLDGSDIQIVYIRGQRYVLCGTEVVRRMGELFMLYAILSPSFIVDDVASGVSKMMNVGGVSE